MNKILLVIKREYFARVKKKSFLLVTLLTPLLFPSILGVFLWIAMNERESEALRIIEVVDENNLFRMESSDQYAFSYSNRDREEAKDLVKSGDRYGFLYIPKIALDHPSGIMYYTDKNPSMAMLAHLESALKRKIEEIRLFDSGIDPNIIAELRTNVYVQAVTLDNAGEEKASNAVVNYILGFIAGILIYMFIFIYGNQIMQGVIEEKSSRIIEILISSIKPFQLMTGKIIGIGLVGLSQFLIWIILISGISALVMGYFGMMMPQQQALEMSNPNAGQILETSAGEMGQYLKVIQDIDFFKLVLTFVFYFIGGYLLYGAFFAAIGAAVDTPSDAQQFMFPVTIPLIVAYFGLFVFVLDDPNSNISFWLSIIPFTSPIAMMGRASYGVPFFDLALSMGLLILGFFFTTWMAGKIYRIGILVHGSKVNYGTLWRWLKTA
ncbi:ABC transporter permease [Anditalea andensis]|uniref:ABC transporter permease n=1 Tax=Anditalea andensis TaxID=1048983 RepID=A0A074LGE9_9BACT|nr:ABC transporter permease [Anditalea andensis]KEO72867.1 ABC transporter permease [Anditalea andensis]